jgi:hypothetical protein
MMDIEPSIDTEHLIRVIRQQYGINTRNLNFLQRGWGGDCYSIESANGGLYFLKVYEQATRFDTAAKSRAFYLPLMDQLYEGEILTNSPYPIHTVDGKLSVFWEFGEIVITNYIHGEVVGFGELPENIFVELAELVGILHRSTTQLSFEHPFTERFEIIPEGDFIQIFKSLTSVTNTDREGRQLLQDVLLPQKTIILKTLEKLKASQKIVKTIKKTMVICHTDLHGANLMIGEGDTLFILDWENAMIAPLEHDMIFFAGESRFFDVFWPRYANQYRKARINLDLLRFYYYRRCLEDVLGITRRVMMGDGMVDRDRSDLKNLVDTLVGLESIDSTISQIREGCIQHGIDFLNE